MGNKRYLTKQFKKIEKQEKEYEKLAERLKIKKLKDFNRARIAAVRAQLKGKGVRRVGVKKVISSFKLKPSTTKALSTSSRKFGRGLVSFINSIEPSDEVKRANRIRRSPTRRRRKRR